MQKASSEEQLFLEELDKKLWNAADRLRSNLDAAVYKHAVLGLIFLKYVSDAFDMRRGELRAAFADPQCDYYLDRADYNSEAEYEAAINAELEDRDYFTEKNVFWVPALARWKTIQDHAALPAGTEITVSNGKEAKYTIRSVARLIDDALEEVEKENPRLKGIIEKNRYSQLQIEPSKLVGLISEVISSIPFNHASLNAKDILGHVYEYFLGQFALAEGKKGGQYYTPKSIVSVIVEMLEPYQGKVYDPAMGSGGFFVQSEAFIEKYGGKIGQISVYGQESNPTTWRLAAMNMAIRGIDFNFGKQPADTLLSDQHPDLRADFVMANPPFNISEWWDGKLEGDPRWVYGVPPKGNANFGWVQHMLYHLAPHGSMALLLANGSMSSNTKGEGEIRKALVEADLVECMLSLPGQLFTNTQIPACVWFLTKSKKARGQNRDRTGEILFIDARQLGFMKDRVLRDFAAADLEKIIGIFRAWKRGKGYADEAGFCKSTLIATVASHDYVLTPGRYVGAEEAEAETEPFEEKMARLVVQLRTQFKESAKYEQLIEARLKGLGYGD
ncbi:MAG: type I restriction-modification system subunit M [Opitutus sp.]|nr:type I restriction-modification system subunit M [Opitutus sp.]MCS6246045.1 type I restriction-modification system subunit M [Opitutus sp.]MCS6273928.1 type I restriction-modification system subunit M [Opitutus sp.]MCS6276228.1 type I restriction-modification system subunit M [Opitutus sp.]MCS6301322.1 type I restriction-modification system subunit M [Opitutus sp.]